MITLGQNIKELRTAHNISQTEIALAAGCSPGTVGRIENGQYSSMALNVKMALNEIIRNRQRTTQQVKHVKTQFAERCMRVQCGINLVAEIADVPARWVVGFHVNCGGYCPECAVAEGKGDVAKALKILKEYPVNLFNEGQHGQEEDGRRGARIRFHRVLQERPRRDRAQCARN